MPKFFRQIIIGLVVIMLIVGTHYLGWLKPIENYLVNIASPVERQAYSLSLGAGSFYHAWLTKRDLLGENENLKKQLVQYQLDSAKMASLTEENNVLRQELGFLKSKNFKFAAAEIMSGVSDPLSQSVIINRGMDSGIQKGQAVISDNGVLVGKVIETKKDSSKVLLLTDNQSKVAATIQNLEKTAGLVEGQFGLSFAMTNIPQSQEIKEGDLVVTSGLEGQIPKGLLIAKVESVSSVESEIFKTAILSPIIPFRNLSQVAVIIP